MRKIILIMGLVTVACNNSSDKNKGKKPPYEVVKDYVVQPPPNEKTDTVFMGLGTEPFWSVFIINDNKIVFHPSDGPDVEVPFVAPSTTNNTTSYHSSAEGSSIDLVITKKPCSDGMSDNVHAYEVILTVNKTKYSGCGNDY